MFAHHPGDNPARAKILDRTPCRNCQQLDRLCNWIANVAARLYSSEPVLHLRIRVQHVAVAQGTKNAHIEIRPGIAGHDYTELCTSKKGCSYRHQYGRSPVLNLTSATKVGLRRNTVHADLTLMAVAGYDERRVRAVLLLKTKSNPPCCGSGQQFARSPAPTSQS